MPSYCFETKELKEIFSRHFGGANGSLFSFEELVEQLCSFRSPPLADLSSTERTIVLLRESLILTNEHIVHCFSSLPETPKNTHLLEEFLKYLHSDKADDWTAAVWSTIGALKEKKIDRTFDSHWTFVKEGESRFLFQEFAKAFPYAKNVETVDVRTFGSCLDVSSLPSSEGHLLRAESADCLMALGKLIVEELKQFPQILVPFHGSPEERSFLTLFLRSRNIQSETLSLNDSVNSFFSKIRTAPFSIERRLKIWHDFKICKCGTVALTDLAILERLKQETKLSEEEHTFLLSQVPVPESEELKQASPSVVVIPWIAPPATAGVSYPILGFAGESLFDFDTHEIDLTNQELEGLFQAGFALPRWGERRRSRLAVMTELLDRGATIFTSLGKEQLPLDRAKEVSLPDSANPELILAPDFTLALPSPTFSATQLETYATCPTKYLLANRLKLRREAIGIEALPLLNGQITHRALELFFAMERTEDAAPLLEQKFKEAMLEIAPHFEANHPISRNLRFQFLKMIPTVLKLESELEASFGPHVPKYFEKEFEIKIEGYSFRGKIDRIDELSDGSLLVLDYKTGTIDFTPDHIRKGSHFQALLYLLGAERLFEKPVAGMLFYDLKNAELRRGLLVEERVSKAAKKAFTRGHTVTFDKYRAILDTGTEQALRLCQEIVAGHFAPTPSAENCSYCDLSTFCRSAYGVV